MMQSNPVLFEETPVFEGPTEHAVALQFHRAYPPAGLARRQRSRDGRIHVAKVRAPAGRADAALSLAASLKRGYPGWQFETGRSSGSQFEIAVSVRNEPAPQGMPAATWWQRLRGLLRDEPVPAPGPSAAEVRRFAQRAFERAHQAWPAGAAKPARVIVHYAYQAWLPLLGDVGRRLAQLGFQVEFRYAGDHSMTDDVREALEQNKLEMQLVGGAPAAPAGSTAAAHVSPATAPASAATPAPPVHAPPPAPAHGPAAVPPRPPQVQAAADADSTLPAPDEAPIEIVVRAARRGARGDQRAETVLAIGGSRSLILGRCGQHASQITGLHESLGCRNRLSRDPDKALIASVDAQGIDVVRDGGTGQWKLQGGKPVVPGMRVAWPVALQFLDTSYTIELVHAPFPVLEGAA